MFWAAVSPGTQGGVEGTVVFLERLINFVVFHIGLYSFLEVNHLIRTCCQRGENAGALCRTDSFGDSAAAGR